jgi:acetaldehyde dehydrogenase (acetylating)
VAVEMAVAVGLAAQNEGLAHKTTLAALRSNVITCQWSPEYSDVDISDEVEVTQ